MFLMMFGGAGSRAGDRIKDFATHHTFFSPGLVLPFAVAFPIPRQRFLFLD
jgi:hypothetical protein